MRRAAAFELLASQLAAANVTPEELLRYLSGDGLAECVTLDRFVADRVPPALKGGQRKVWTPYLALLTGGCPGLCACFCDACLDAFIRDSRWTPCPGVTTGECHCAAADLATGSAHATSCLDHAPAHGARSPGALHLSDLAISANWAETRAQKRTAVRNRARGAAGRATYAHDGRSAREHLRSAASCAFKLALAEGIPGVRTNIALDLPVKARPPVPIRSYTPEQLEAFWLAIFTSGGNDPELDMCIVWFTLETGSRRGGVIGLRIGDILFAGRVLLRTDAPVFRYRGSRPDAPHPTTRKRFDTLWG